MFKPTNNNNTNKRARKILTAASRKRTKLEHEAEPHAEMGQALESSDDHDPQLAVLSSSSIAKHKPSEGNTALKKEITGVGRHFSKIASRFMLADDETLDLSGKGYLDWTVQFKTEMKSYDLADTLTQDPNQTDPMDPDLEAHRQKTVYHMIHACVPNHKVRQVITTALSPEDQTGYGAWMALRAHYIGDEQAYLMSLESKFENFQWENQENWSTFETRYESLTSEMAAMGIHKMDHQRKGRLMSAIQESNRKDAQGTSVYERLHTTNRINASLVYRQWLVAIRTEAQMIQDEMKKKGVSLKRTRGENEEQRELSQEVSFVSPFGSFNSGQNMRPAFRGQGGAGQGFGQRGPSNRGPTSNAACWDYSRTGQCKFGSGCRYSHTGAPGGGGGASGGYNSGSGGFGRPGSVAQVDPHACRDFARRGCPRGASCRWKHITPNRGGGSGPDGGRPNTGPGGANTNQQSEKIVQHAETY